MTENSSCSKCGAPEGDAPDGFWLCGTMKSATTLAECGTSCLIHQLAKERQRTNMGFVSNEAYNGAVKRLRFKISGALAALNLVSGALSQSSDQVNNDWLRAEVSTAISNLERR